MAVFVLLQTYLCISNKWKILSKWMTLKSIVCENATKVWVISKVNAKQVPYLSHAAKHCVKTTNCEEVHC